MREKADAAEIEVTPGMIEAGVRAYVLSASHDDMSFDTREVTVRLILEAAISRMQRL